MGPAKILHYLFLFIFYQSGLTTKDRATQYAQSLREYFNEGRSPSDVDKILRLHGQDRLRKAAQRQAELVKGALEFAKQGGNPAAVSMDEMLTLMAEEDAKKARAPTDDEVTDYGPRGLPPLESELYSDARDHAELGVEGKQLVEPAENDRQLAADGEGDENTTSEDIDAEHKANDIHEDRTIDGQLIDDRLEQILFGTMNLGASLMAQPLDPDVKRHIVKMTVLLSNDLLDLRRIINGV